MSWVLYEDDCFEVFPSIEDGSIDMILCDLPYGTTACKWDTPLPLDELWLEYKRIIKSHGAIVLTGSQPFTSKLVMSNPSMFRYEWIWEKEQGVNFQLANKQPLKITENILIFSKNSPNYYPQGLIEVNRTKSNTFKGGNLGHNSSEKLRDNYIQVYSNYPSNLIKFNRERGLHPTQKPVALFEYLIKTYTNEHDLVLDNCAGSGTTGVACQNLNRDCILIEKEPEYCDIIRERMQTVQELQVEQRKQQTLFDYEKE